MKKAIHKICSRGHRFSKSSECPVCPICWSGYYKDKRGKGFPGLGAPALRALLNVKVFNLLQLAKHTEAQVLALHGMGPSSLPKLRSALKAKKMSFKTLNNEIQ